MTIRNFDALFEPRSVALIGASERPGSIGATVLHNLHADGFSGPIWLVNPKHDQISGYPCCRRIADLPAAPDLAVVVTPPASVPGIIAELAAKGTRAAAVLTAGLDDKARTAMLEASRPHLLRILGPNILGLMLPRLKLNASFAHRSAPPGHLALVSQSGALITAIVDWAAGRDIGFSHVVSLGDMSDVDFGDVLDYLAGDVDSRAILLYMEAVTDAAKFMSAARRAARVKPVIVVKSGRHAAAARAAASHTGRLAGSNAVYDAAFRRAGLLRVDDLDELFEAAELLARVPRLEGERLTILTNGGGAGVLAADRLADFDGELAMISPETQAALDAFLPANWSRGNPVDIIGDSDAERYGKALRCVIDDKQSDAVLALYCPTAVGPGIAVAERVVAEVNEAAARSGRRPIVLTNWLGEAAARQSRAYFASHFIPTFDTPGAAARGFMHLVRFRRAQEALMRMPDGEHAAQIALDTAAHHLIEHCGKEQRFALNEPDSKALIASSGIPVVESRAVRSPQEAGEAAGALLVDHPSVVLKILSRDISHKSDVDGVRLDLATPEAVEAQASAMLARVKELRPSARIDGFSLSPMIRRKDAHELILGISVDPTFGPMVLFGAGGTAVEVLKDTALALLPIDHDGALGLIRQTRISRLLAGYRDKPAANLEAIADAIVRLGHLAIEFDAIREIDINPLLADASGVIALDARVRLARPEEGARVPLVIKPYPAQWEKRLLIEGIGGILIRPIVPADEHLYDEFLAAISPEDHRLRFFQPKAKLTHRFIARLTQIDYARDMAFVALDMESGHLLGVARFAADPDFVSGEYAVLVRSDLKGKGLGWQLMSHLIDYARAAGLQEIFGSVLAENLTMLAMCRQLGFKVGADRDDAAVRHVSLRLAPA